jgi:uncharacterized protein (TIGR02996 family)
MRDERALFDDLLRNPHSEATRLAYAECLERRGHLQGEYIRLFHEAARVNGGWAKVDLMLQQHEQEWAQPIRHMVEGWQFCWGILQLVRLTGPQFVQHADTLFETTPIGHLDVKDALPIFDALCTSPYLARLRSLNLNGNELDDDHCVRLASLPALSEVRWIDLGNNDIHERGVEALAASPHLRKLRVLWLAGNPCDPREWIEREWDGSFTQAHFPELGAQLEARHGYKLWLHPEKEKRHRCDMANA